MARTLGARLGLTLTSLLLVSAAWLGWSRYQPQDPGKDAVVVYNLGVLVTDAAGRPLTPVTASLTIAGSPYGSMTPPTDPHKIFSVQARAESGMLHVEVPGYKPRDVSIALGNEELPPLVLTPTGPSAGQAEGISVDGLVFRDDRGAIWPWRGTDGFLLYLHWLKERAGIDAVVANWLTCGGLCRDTPPNTIRVLGMVNSFAHLWPQEHADYYSQLRPFVDHLWSAFRVRVEFVIFADAGVVMPDRAQEDRHADAVLAAFEDAPNVFLEVANEPSQHTNLPGGDAEAFRHYQRLKGRGLLIATGAGDGSNAGDYVTVHTPRDNEWPRKAKDLLDLRDAVHRPVVGDEPIGFAEVARPGSRATSAGDAASYAAAAALLGAGSTFHSDSGVAYELFGPVQAAAAAAWHTAAAWVPPAAQLSPYQAGGAGGGAGIGDMPLVHFNRDDPAHAGDGASATFCKLTDGVEYCAAVRPGPQWTAVGRAGWRVLATGPAHGLVTLSR